MATRLGAQFVTYLTAIDAMRAGFATGNFADGLFVAKMPEDCINHS
jgi:hypothetical protein